MRRDNPVNKTQLVLTLHSCSKLEFNAGGDGVRKGRKGWTRQSGYLSPAFAAAHRAYPLGLLMLLRRGR